MAEQEKIDAKTPQGTTVKAIVIPKDDCTKMVVGFRYKCPNCKAAGMTRTPIGKAFYHHVCQTYILAEGTLPIDPAKLETAAKKKQS